MAVKNVELKFIREIRNKFDDFWDVASIIPGTLVNAHSAEVKINLITVGRSFLYGFTYFAVMKRAMFRTKYSLKSLMSLNKTGRALQRKTGQKW